MKATVLVDNMAYNGLPGEWGLSIYIEYDDIRILLDTGASGLFAENARKLGLSIAKVDYAVLSHAHYDHSYGMKAFFAHNDQAKWYVREGTAENCYVKKWMFHKYIGLPRRILADYQDRMVYVTGDYRLCPGVYLIPHKTPGLSRLGKRENMYRKTPGGWCSDDFSHEQSLVLETDKGLVIFNSCSHGGAANSIREVAETFPGKKVYGLIGGFHLFNKSADEITALSRDIKETGIAFVCTGHCTKDRAYDILKQDMGDALHPLHVGLVMEF